jgi:anti-anti-sigma factor
MDVIRKEQSEQEVELKVHANLNDQTVGEFRTALYAELDHPHHRISIDLEKVHSISSAALGAILLFQKKAREKNMGIRISKCSEELRKTLKAIRLDRIIEMAGEEPPTIKN